MYEWELVLFIISLAEIYVRNKASKIWSQTQRMNKCQIESKIQVNNAIAINIHEMVLGWRSIISFSIVNYIIIVITLSVWL